MPYVLMVLVGRRGARLCLLCMAMLLGACKQLNYSNVSGFAQGSTFSITYGDAQGRDFSGAIDSILRLADTTLSVFNDASVLSRINRNEQQLLPPLLRRAIELSEQVAEATQGAFDITIGPVTRAIGFAGGTSRGIDTARVAELMRHVGMDKVALRGDTLLKASPQVFIDLNGIAQGLTVDMIGEHFERNGVRHYVVEVGGEILAQGHNRRGTEWVVGIDSPVEGALPGQHLQAKLYLSGGRGLATSGNYRKVVEVDGQRYSHTIDPQTGLPTLNALLSATVVAPSASWADALGTAFMVRGLEWSKAYVQAHPEVEAVLVYADSTGANRMWSSAGIRFVR